MSAELQTPGRLRSRRWEHSCVTRGPAAVVEPSTPPCAPCAAVRGPAGLLLATTVAVTCASQPALLPECDKRSQGEATCGFTASGRSHMQGGSSGPVRHFGVLGVLAWQGARSRVTQPCSGTSHVKCTHAPKGVRPGGTVHACESPHEPLQCGISSYCVGVAHVTVCSTQ